ncbi:hydroxyethylthiazole kinase [Clostridium transplantifaecale]|uniref:hydroxyethylthiazole kinase n=1 Tax=Clostridium transplantifaecale TaxID=2479838 RepID=UPI000F63F419|nr:hydroxyethylthiazole kinase [Clostridium transplantifaecale]
MINDPCSINSQFPKSGSLFPDELLHLPQLIRERSPLIHCITNYVTACEVANIILAAGAAPVMADHPDETADMTSRSDCLLLNFGTLKESSAAAMSRAGKKAGELGLPLILDPVGIGSSPYRTSSILNVLSQVKPAVIRGNTSEIKRLYLELTRGTAAERKIPALQLQDSPRGVDASRQDQITQVNLSSLIGSARGLSDLTGAVVVMTGETDLVTSADKTMLIHNGCPMMSRITGSGCMLDGIIAAYVSTAILSAASATESAGTAILSATALAVSAAGLCGELACRKVGERGEGTGSFLRYFTDYVSLFDEETLKRGMKIDIS